MSSIARSGPAGMYSTELQHPGQMPLPRRNVGSAHIRSVTVDEAQSFHDEERIWNNSFLKN